MPIRTLIALLMVTPLGWGAISSTMVWNVRSDGNNANGGGFNAAGSSPGTDYSLQAAAQVAFTDLIVGGTTTELTSVLNTITSAYPRNVINITGGAGCTVGEYEMVSQTGGIATMDRSVGTAASVCTGNLGGAKATVLYLIPAGANIPISGNTISIKSGTYSAAAILSVEVSTLTLRGYGSTIGDGGTCPLITTATDSLDLITHTAADGFVTWDNICFSNTASVRAIGMKKTVAQNTTGALLVRNSKFSGFSNAINSDNFGARFQWNAMYLINVGVTGSTSTGLEFTGTGATHLWAKYLYVGDGAGNAIVYSNSFYCDNCIFYNHVAYTLNMSSGTSSTGITSLNNCIFHTVTGTHLKLSTTTGPLFISNSVFWGATDYAIDGSVPQAVNDISILASRNNAYGNNGLDFVGWSFSSGDVSLVGSVDLFVNSAAGNFSLTASGIEKLGSQGFPGTMVIGGTGYMDLGAIPAGGSATTIGIPQ